VIRTYNGWFAVAGFTLRGSAVRFLIDTTQEIAPNALDREILVRAATIISSDSVWNRLDNRKCPATATKWSIYCAVEQAQVEVPAVFITAGRRASLCARSSMSERRRETTTIA
jgi:hypothetical protein